MIQPLEVRTVPKNARIVASKDTQLSTFPVSSLDVFVSKMPETRPQFAHACQNARVLRPSRNRCANEQSRSMCDPSYSRKQERWNVYCIDVTFVEGNHRMSSRDLGCAVGSVFRGGHFADLFKDPAEIGWIGITTAGSDLL